MAEPSTPHEWVKSRTLAELIDLQALFADTQAHRNYQSLIQYEMTRRRSSVVVVLDTLQIAADRGMLREGDDA